METLNKKSIAEVVAEKHAVIEGKVAVIQHCLRIFKIQIRRQRLRQAIQLIELIRYF